MSGKSVTRFSASDTFENPAPCEGTMSPNHDIIAERIGAIEAEMKRLGLWQDAPLRPEQYRFERAFAMDAMSDAQWLQFVFIPRGKSIVAERGAFPQTS